MFLFLGKNRTPLHFGPNPACSEVQARERSLPHAHTGPAAWAVGVPGGDCQIEVLAWQRPAGRAQHWAVMQLDSGSGHGDTGPHLRALLVTLPGFTPQSDVAETPFLCLVFQRGPRAVVSRGLESQMVPFRCVLMCMPSKCFVVI